MNIPDKVPYLLHEKTAEAISAVMVVCSAAVEIVMMALGVMEGSTIILLLVSLIVYVIFSVCSAWPQWTNLVNKPEECTEARFHAIRMGCIVAKLALNAALFLIAFL